MRSRRVSAEILAAMQGLGMREGWAESLIRLRALLADAAMSAPRAVPMQVPVPVPGLAEGR